MIKEKLGANYLKVVSPGGDYALFYLKSKPFSQKPVSVVSFVVLKKDGTDILYEKRNFHGSVEWATESALRLREEIGVLLNNDTNIREYYYDVSRGKRVNQLKNKEF